MVIEKKKEKTARVAAKGGFRDKAVRRTSRIRQGDSADFRVYAVCLQSDA